MVETWTCEDGVFHAFFTLAVTELIIRGLMGSHGVRFEGTIPGEELCYLTICIPTLSTYPRFMEGYESFRPLGLLPKPILFLLPFLNRSFFLSLPVIPFYLRNQSPLVREIYGRCDDDHLSSLFGYGTVSKYDI